MRGVGEVIEVIERRPAWQRHVLLLLAFVLVAAPLIGWKAVDNRQLSIFDEWQYADRVHQVATGDYVIRDGERISAWGHRQLSCRGIVRIVEPQPDKCRTKHGLAPTPNSAASDPPTYFVITGVTARAVMATGLTDNLITTARLVGIGWAALAMWMVYLLARTLGARRAAALLAASTQLLVPVFSQQFTYLTPHALDVPVGAFVAMAGIRWMRGEWGLWTLAVGGFLAAFSKGTNITIVVAIGIFFLAVIVWPGQFSAGRRRRALWGGLVLGVTTAVVTVGWSWVVGQLRVAVVDPPGDYIVDSLDPTVLLADSIRFIAPFGEVSLIFFGTLLIGAMTGTALVTWAGGATAGPLMRPLAAGYVLGAMASPVVLAIFVYVSSDQYIGTQVRYGLAVWALGLAFASRLLTTRTALALAAVVLVGYWWMPFVWGLDGVTM